MTSSDNFVFPASSDAVEAEEFNKNFPIDDEYGAADELDTDAEGLSEPWRRFGFSTHTISPLSFPEDEIQPLLEVLRRHRAVIVLGRDAGNKDVQALSDAVAAKLDIADQRQAFELSDATELVDQDGAPIELPENITDLMAALNTIPASANREASSLIFLSLQLKPMNLDPLAQSLVTMFDIADLSRALEVNKQFLLVGIDVPADIQLPRAEQLKKDWIISWPWVRRMVEYLSDIHELARNPHETEKLIQELEYKVEENAAREQQLYRALYGEDPPLSYASIREKCGRLDEASEESLQKLKNIFLSGNRILQTIIMLAAYAPAISYSLFRDIGERLLSDERVPLAFLPDDLRPLTPTSSDESTEAESTITWKSIWRDRLDFFQSQAGVIYKSGRLSGISATRTIEFDASWNPIRVREYIEENFPQALHTFIQRVSSAIESLDINRWHERDGVLIRLLVTLAASDQASFGSRWLADRCASWASSACTSGTNPDGGDHRITNSDEMRALGVAVRRAKVAFLTFARSDGQNAGAVAQASNLLIQSTGHGPLIHFSAKLFDWVERRHDDAATNRAYLPSIIKNLRPQDRAYAVRVFEEIVVGRPPASRLDLLAFATEELPGAEWKPAAADVRKILALRLWERALSREAPSLGRNDLIAVTNKAPTTLVQIFYGDNARDHARLVNGLIKFEPQILPFIGRRISIRLNDCFRILFEGSPASFGEQAASARLKAEESFQKDIIRSLYAGCFDSTTLPSVKCLEDLDDRRLWARAERMRSEGTAVQRRFSKNLALSAELFRAAVFAQWRFIPILRPDLFQEAHVKHRVKAALDLFLKCSENSDIVWRFADAFQFLSAQCRKFQGPAEDALAPGAAAVYAEKSNRLESIGRYLKQETTSASLEAEKTT